MREKVFWAAFLCLSCLSLACTSDPSVPEGESDDLDLVKAGSCAERVPIQQKWEDLLVGGEAATVTRAPLPAAAKTHYDIVRSRHVAAYKATIDGQVTFAISSDPENGDGEILVEYVIFKASGAVVAKGYSKDSPQIYWRGRCR
jgi:hypothetical protein